jgi:hypothetical protein
MRLVFHANRLINGPEKPILEFQVPEFQVLGFQVLAGRIKLVHM